MCHWVVVVTIIQHGGDCQAIWCSYCTAICLCELDHGDHSGALPAKSRIMVCHTALPISLWADSGLGDLWQPPDITSATIGSMNTTGWEILFKVKMLSKPVFIPVMSLYPLFQSDTFVRSKACNFYLLWPIEKTPSKGGKGKWALGKMLTMQVIMHPSDPCIFGAPRPWWQVLVCGQQWHSVQWWRDVWRFLLGVSRKQPCGHQREEWKIPSRRPSWNPACWCRHPAPGHTLGILSPHPLPCSTLGNLGPKVAKPAQEGHRSGAWGATSASSWTPVALNHGLHGKGPCWDMGGLSLLPVVLFVEAAT